jgi:hypothetical protein
MKILSMINDVDPSDNEEMTHELLEIVSLL